MGSLGRTGRSFSATRTNGGNQGIDVARLEAKVSDLQRVIMGLEDENENLKKTMRDMVDDYTRQLQIRDDTIRALEAKGYNSLQMGSLRQEAEELRDENRALKDQVYQLNREVEKGAAKNQASLREEVDRLNRALIEKDRCIERQVADQKNEWAEIYGNHKITIDKQIKEIDTLKKDKAQLLKRLNESGTGNSGPSTQEFQETTKRLKKRELECQALWDTLKDMKNSEQQTFDKS
jgi:predicted RNase H-like nuclease (RuvC/YqgF family)